MKIYKLESGDYINLEKIVSIDDDLSSKADSKYTYAVHLDGYNTTYFITESDLCSILNISENHISLT